MKTLPKPVKLFELIYTVPDPYAHDIKLDNLKTSDCVAFKFRTILQNFIATNHRESGKNKYDHKLPELDVVIRYCVNGVLLSEAKDNFTALVFKQPNETHD